MDFRKVFENAGLVLSVPKILYPKSFLAITGITKDVVIPFSYTESVNTATIKASFKINRRDYNVGESSWTMSDDFIVNLLLSLAK